jgi:hypothetical protein
MRIFSVVVGGGKNDERVSQKVVHWYSPQLAGRSRAVITIKQLGLWNSPLHMLVIWAAVFGGGYGLVLLGLAKALKL